LLQTVRVLTPHCFAEQIRLQRRTATLNAWARELANQEHPFSPFEYEELNAQLTEHNADLAAFFARCLQPEGDGGGAGE
jgi:hypothetical protein